MTKERAHVISAPCVSESPLCLECKVTQVLELGSHDMFIAEVVSTDVDERLLDEEGRLDLTRAKLIAYSHGEYWTLGRKVGKFGFTSLKSEKENNLKEKKQPKELKGRKKSRLHHK